VPATVTWDALRELAGFRSQNRCALSLYLDLDPSTTPTQAEAETKLNSLLAQAEKQFGSNTKHPRADKVAMKANLGRVRDWWEDEFDRDGARGVALFASQPDDLWQVMALPGAVQDGVHLGSQLCLTPLVDLANSDDGALVAFVNRERGQVFRLRAGRLDEIVDRTEEQPGQHDQGGWSQARFQRHIEKLVAEHLKTVGEEIDKRVRRTRGPRIVIVAPEDLRGEIESSLSHEAQEAIVGWTTAEAHAAPAELLSIVLPHLEEARIARLQEVLDHWRAERGRDGRASAGWEETLTAASDGRVELLLVARGVHRPAHRCPKCGRAEASAVSCPLDGTELEPADGLDLAVHHTLSFGGIVATVTTGELDDAEGIGALLRF
jgi:peptide chain release factor subunit 1